MEKRENPTGLRLTSSDRMLYYIDRCNKKVEILLVKLPSSFVSVQKTVDFCRLQQTNTMETTDSQNAARKLITASY
jgi:hypothetical protein